MIENVAIVSAAYCSLGLTLSQYPDRYQGIKYKFSIFEIDMEVAIGIQFGKSAKLSFLGLLPTYLQRRK